MGVEDHTYIWVKDQGWVPKSKLKPITYKTAGAWNKPLTSKSLGVHPSQAGEFNEMARKFGNRGVYYDESGTCHFESRGARNLEMKRRGKMDMDAGYGDHAGR